MNFKIIEKISESTTTSVYKAFHPALERNVLLKILHKHLSHDPEISERFRREARALAALRSEHIVQVYDLTDIDGSPAIVMEFVDGKSLKQVIEESGKLPFENVRKIAVHVLRGLAVAHEHGIIHRDIKPGNILIDRKGIIKVTDFGLAFMSVTSSVTMDGVVLGTPAYMSPEQIRGEVLDGRSDLFSFGVTLVELLTGTKIFDGISYSECIKKISGFTAESLSQIDLHASQEFTTFLQFMMEPEVTKRIPTAVEGLAALGEKQSGSIQSTNILQKRKTFIPAIILFMIILGVVGIVTLNSSKRTEAQGIPESPAFARIDTVIDTNKNIPVKTLEAEASPKPASSRSINVKEITASEKLTKAAVDSGSIVISSIPWAKVFVNNHYIGETPISEPVTLPAGSVTVIFNNPLFEPIVKIVEVHSHMQSTIFANFMENVGYILPQATPWAEIYIDDQNRGTTPLSKPIIVSSGKRKIRFHNPGFRDILKEISVTSNDTIRISVNYLEKHNDP